MTAAQFKRIAKALAALDEIKEEQRTRTYRNASRDEIRNGTIIEQSADAARETINAFLIDVKVYSDDVAVETLANAVLFPAGD